MNLRKKLTFNEKIEKFEKKINKFYEILFLIFLNQYMSSKMLDPRDLQIIKYLIN